MHTFPDIGLDPLAHRDQVKGGVEGAKERLTAAVTLQQTGVPDQTALVWRIDLDRLLCDHIWRSCHLEPLKRAHADVERLQAENAKLREERVRLRRAIDQLGFRFAGVHDDLSKRCQAVLFKGETFDGLPIQPHHVI